MALDIRGSLKNTRISKNPFVVFDELLSNAIDSYLIRKNAEPQLPSFSVEFAIEFIPSDLFDGADIKISCSDNGCGLGEEQLEAFLTKDTSYKDDLKIAGIGHCKGTGRVQFFHYFSHLNISSIYQQNREPKKRTFTYDGTKTLINKGDFTITSASNEVSGTKFALSYLKDKALEIIGADGDLRHSLSSANIKGHLLIAFLQRLIGLQDQLGDFSIKIKTTGMEADSKETLSSVDLPEITDRQIAKVIEQDPKTGAPLKTFQNITVSHYKLDANKYNIPKNSVALCAKSSPVSDITNQFLRSKTVETNPVSGFYHLVLVESKALDASVNEQRDKFSLPERIPSGDLFADARISFDAIFDAIADIVGEMVGPPDWDRERTLQSMVDKFGVTGPMLTETQTQVRHGEDPDTVAGRVLKKYQDRIISETSAIYDLKEEIKKLEPDTEDFRTKVSELAWKYTSALPDIDKANLSQLVVRRAAIVEILALACAKELDIQNGSGNERRKDEKLIHSVFFPMKKDSEQVSDHDIWLLNEEYQYYQYIASDKPLSQLKWEGEQNLFDSDIDVAMAKLINSIYSENSGKRPDIALFNKEGSAIIIEFKAPDVSMDDHVGDLRQYALLLAAKSGGRLKKFYGYLIGDKLDINRLDPEYTDFPERNGYFRTEPLEDRKNRQRLGELYSEILFYDDVTSKANQRLAVYKEKLGIDLR